jgi:hypothetical protein
MVERAGQDNNHLQKAVNVRESAFTWVQIKCLLRRIKANEPRKGARRVVPLESRILGSKLSLAFVLCLAC